MRLAFFGTGEFAIPILEALSKGVVLVVTQPDRPSGRGMRSRASPVKTCAERLGLPVETPAKCRDLEFVGRIANLKLDALVVAAYGQILSPALLEAATRGGINLHGSLLPAYRGAAPIQRAILAGDALTGVTLMQMDAGMDSGDVIASEETAIGEDETYSELQGRLARLAAELAADWMPRIVQGNYPRAPQDPDNATFAPKIAKSDAELDFSRPARGEYDRYRAVTERPGAFIRTARGNLGLRRLRWTDQQGEPGTVLNVSPGLVIAFEGGSLEFAEVQPEGKNRMSGRDLANGWRLAPGTSLRYV